MLEGTFLGCRYIVPQLGINKWALSLHCPILSLFFVKNQKFDNVLWVCYINAALRTAVDDRVIEKTNHREQGTGKSKQSNHDFD